MENKKIQNLICLMDSHQLQMNRVIDPELLKTTIPNGIIPEPTLIERAIYQTWDLCYLRYLDTKKDGTPEDFKKNWVPTSTGIKTYDSTLNEVIAKLKEVVTGRDLKNFIAKIQKDNTIPKS